ncbi:MAG: hypothetical protein HGA45_07190 [Chloroflexales bacterium]|nr:hypothetical protein [Chloroflexales bacterium]
MEQRALGASGLTVPAVGMGTWRTFDVRGAAASANARAVVDVALAAGAPRSDSSPMHGAAAQVLGKALRAASPRARPLASGGQPRTIPPPALHHVGPRARVGSHLDREDGRAKIFIRRAP